MKAGEQMESRKKGKEKGGKGQRKDRPQIKSEKGSGIRDERSHLGHRTQVRR